MEFGIAEYDIHSYILEHSQDIRLKYRESMFARFMKIPEMQDEKKEIIYNNRDLGLFEEFISKQELDVSGIWHILVPTLAYYDMFRYDAMQYSKMNNTIDYINIRFNKLEEKLKESIKDGYYTNALDDYLIAELIDFKNFSYYSLMDKERAQKELEEYRKIYNEGVVEIVNDHVKELKYRN